jgi:uncharacterized protein YndB with AHSA1/START domain
MKETRMELGKARKEAVVIHEVEREVVLHATPEEAWEAFSDPGRLGEWLGAEVELEPVPGGELHVRFEGGEERSGFVEEVEPAERLAFWWRRPGEDLSTRVQIELSQHEEGTLLRLLETSPLATLDLVGIPLPGSGMEGPVALALA